MGSYVEGENKTGEHNQENRKKFCRVGQGSPESYHVKAKHFQLLYVQRKKKESAKYCN